MISSYFVFFLVSLLTKNLVTNDEIPIQDDAQSIISIIPKMTHEKTHREMRDHLLPKIRQISQRMQSIILSTTKSFDKMQKLQDVTHKSCLPSSLILYINELSKNLTRIVKIEVPFIEKELKRIMLDIDKVENEINQFTYHNKQLKIVEINKKQLEILQELTSTYGKLNDETFKLNEKLIQIIDEILNPGLGPVDQYNECMNSTAHALIDHSLDQIVENIDHVDENQILLSNDILLSNNHTDL